MLFADMGGFTARSSDTTPEELVRFLNRVYTSLDSLVERHGLEKIKSAGNSDIVSAACPSRSPIMPAPSPISPSTCAMRSSGAGRFEGPARASADRHRLRRWCAGVVGTRKFFYDVWGDAVDTAARDELSRRARPGLSGTQENAPAARRTLRA